FGTAYTRNAAIGRARRLGLSVPLRPPSASVMCAPKKPDVRRIVESRNRRLGSGAAKSATPKPSTPKPSTPKPSTLERAAALQLRCVAIMPRHLALIDLEANDCRYPYGGETEGEAITFCGHPRREGSSYCVSHFHLTRLPEPAAGTAEGARTRLRLVEAA
ncbi:MAG TPA: GcrA family cell cycle regulator, partial [Bradyrhizobium sp.]|uniref:GcrA family cell cycle regulator n=1 Tax=Bradyrhizobium sp. TaxID=376 RepID=UPI002D7ECDA8